MNDADVITAVQASYAGIHMDVPLDVIVRRGSRLRSPIDGHFFLQRSSPIFCQAPLFSISETTVISLGLFRVTVVRVLAG